ncbi:MAG TPA: AIM24 family protein [Byssovorax sp.]
MGDYERASHAFAAGGHDAMARRLLEMSGQGTMSLRPEPLAQPAREMRKAAGEAFQELDRTDAFRPASDQRRIPSGTWTAIEPGREPLAASAPAFPPSLAPADLGASPGAHAGSAAASRDLTPEALEPSLSVRAFTAPPSSDGRGPPSDVAISSVGHAVVVTPPRRAVDVAQAELIVFPRDHTVAVHPSGVVLVQAATGFATRLECVRSFAYAVGWKSAPLHRKTRGRTLDEPLGGAASPVVEISGRGELVLGPALGQRLLALAIDADPVYVREDALVGFEPGVSYENGRLPVGDGEAIAMVQLRGHGAAVVTASERSAALEIGEGKSTALRASRVLGWVGRVVPRGLSPSEAPGALRGFVTFAGEGMVLVDER